MIVREFITKFGFNVDQAKLAGMDQKIANLKAGMLKLSLVAAGVGYGIKRLVTSTAAYGDAVHKGSKRMGISTDVYQEMDHAAQLSGASIGTVEATFRALGRAAEQANQGSKMSVDAFKTLGVSVNDAEGKMKTADVLFEEVADGLLRMEDVGRRDAIAMQTLGRGAIQLKPMLEGGSAGIRAMRKELDIFGKMSEEDVQLSADYTDQMRRFQVVIDQLKHRIGLAFMPVVVKLTDRFKAWYAINKDIVKVRIEATVEKLGKALEFTAKHVTKFVAAWATFKAVKLAKSLIEIAGLLRVVGVQALAVAAPIAAAGKAAMLAGVAAAGGWLPFIALGVLIAVVVGTIILVVDDLITYFRGGKSVLVGEYRYLAMLIGNGVKAGWRFLKGLMGKIWEGIKALGGAIGGFFVGLWARAVAGFDAAVDWLADGLDWVVSIFGDAIDGIGEVFDWLWDGITSAFDAVVGAIKDGLNTLIEYANKLPGINIDLIPTTPGGEVPAEGAEDIARAMYRGLGGPQAALAGAGIGGGSSTTTMTVGEITVNAGNAGSPAQVGKAVQDGVRREIEAAARRSQRNWQTGEA